MFNKTFNCKYFRDNFQTDLSKTANQLITNSVETIFISLGNERTEVLGFKTEEQIETALIPLMSEVFNNEPLTVK